MVEQESSKRLRLLFGSLQEILLAKLQGSRTAIEHSTAKGDASEFQWKEMLGQLPSRYAVERAFVVDSTGRCSEQLDLVIFDRHFSPLIFNMGGAIYVPAESVYGVLEVRQELSRENILYAGKKVESARLLGRTSVPVPYVEGTYRAKELFPILGGILALESSWTPPLGEALSQALAALSPEQRLDVGCIIRDGSFGVEYEGESVKLETSSSESALVFFFLRLLRLLQGLGSVPAIDLAVYETALRENPDP